VGLRLRVLVLDEGQAAVVARIFAEYLDGAGDRAIAAGFNRDGIPCPSASRPEQNLYRRRDGWQGSTVRAILENPRYTGYAVFGRWTNRVVRSRMPAHPAIVSVAEFTQAQLRRQARAAGGIATLERERPATGRTCCAGWSAASCASARCRAGRTASACSIGASPASWRRDRPP
jgi:hypothetical protein